MTNNWYIVSVSCEKTLDNGTRKKVTEKYLVDAMTPSEAELRFIKTFGEFFSEFKVKSISEESISEMFYADGLDQVRWYKAVVAFISLDEKTGTEKKRKSNMYVQAPSFKSALVNLNNGMKGTMSDWEVSSITETPVVDVIKCDDNQE